jgi:hypothetical protein
LKVEDLEERWGWWAPFHRLAALLMLVTILGGLLYIGFFLLSLSGYLIQELLWRQSKKTADTTNTSIFDDLEVDEEGKSTKIAKSSDVFSDA